MKNKKIIKVKLKKAYKRTLILVTALLLLLEGVYVFTRYFSNRERIIEDAENYGESIATNVRLSLDRSISTSYVSKKLYMLNKNDYYANFDKICEGLMEDDSTIGSLYFAPEGIIEYAYPKDVNEATIGFEMLKDKEQAELAQLAISTKRVTVAGPHKLIEGGTGFIIRNPIFIDDEFKAFTVIVINCDKFVDELLGEIKNDNSKYKFAVWKEKDEHAVVDEYGFIFKNCDGNVSKLLDIKINIPNDLWHLSVEPIKGWNFIKGIIPEIAVSLILLIGFLYFTYSRFKKSSIILNTFECDELTGLFTKQVFYHTAREIIDKNSNVSYAIVVADIENFKMINRTYGENMGDEVLIHLANIFAANIKEGELCARLGGDQFVFLLVSKREEGRPWIYNLIFEIQEKSPISGVTVKFGVYEDVDHNLSIAAMTDRALLSVKSIKRNFDIVIGNYDGPVSKKHLKVQMFEANFERALKNEEFVVWYQPKFDAVSETIVGAEALVRWQMADGTFVSPGEFIPVFEEDGLIVRLDEYVFRKVCQSIKYWLDKGAKIFPISVNLSRASLFHEGTVEKYKEIVNEIGIPVQYVPIELTESAEFHSVQIKDLTKEMKNAGFMLHMDDFGSGVSSLASFNILPFDVVKLDKSLVDFIGDSSGDELLKYTIALAHFKEMKVVAEGVETKEQLDLLRALECDMIQGYYFSKPRPYEEFIEYLRKLCK